MAKNYTFAEAVEIINAGTDLESISDIGRRFPTLLHKVTRVTTKAGEDFVDLMKYMPDYLTANKVNSALKNATGSTESEGAEEDAPEVKEETKAETKAEVKEEAETTGTDYESMSAKQLWDILGKAGLRKTAKSTKKADLVEACKAMDAAKAGDAEEATEEATTEAEETSEANPYEGKSAMDLFKECKARGIKAAPKKPAKFYADLLIEADAKAKAEEAEAETESESNDWDAEEKEEPKAKPSKKAEPKKAAKKEEADDDDDWDI